MQGRNSLDMAVDKAEAVGAAERRRARMGRGRLLRKRCRRT